MIPHRFLDSIVFGSCDVLLSWKGCMTLPNQMFLISGYVVTS